MPYRLTLLAAALLCAAPAAFAAAPAPKDVLGHTPGDDYYLASYEDSLKYFHALAAGSDRIRIFTAGKTTHGKPMEYAVVSSPANLARLEHYEDISRRLAAVKGLDDAAAQALAAEGKAIVHIDGGMHSSEVSAHQSEIMLAYKLVAADDADTRAILDNVIVVLWPTLNPDGMDMVVDWYRKQRGTRWETSRVPWLYQEYVGHDNNRDGYMLNMLESQVIFKAEQQYSPEIWYSHHQSAPAPARIWMPPFADPISSNISPYMRTWTGLIGMNMMAAFDEHQLPGAIAQARFDNWYPGFLDYTHVFRNTMAFFTEVAHDSATPKLYKVDDFPKTSRDLRAQVMYPEPWQGGWWHLADSVKYDMVASMSVLDTASRYRQVLLYNRYQAGRDTIKRYASQGPYAYVIPAGQTDAAEAALLAQKLIDQGLSVYRARGDLALGGKSYPAGSWVIPMDQPFANLVQELFERQKYPDAILDGNGKPVDLPYDVTGWTLPLQMGVATAAVTAPLDTETRAALEPVAVATAAGGVSGEGEAFALSRKVNASYAAVNDALREGAKLGVATAATATPQGEEAGAFVLTRIGRDAMQRIAAARGASVLALAQAPANAAAQPSRVGLYRPWGWNIDEGWTRWLLEQYRYDLHSLHNADIQAGRLDRKLDVLILPDLGTDKITPADALTKGLKPDEAPPPYAGGIDAKGVDALKDFVRRGGTLVAFNKASDAVIDLFDLPVTDVLKGLKSDRFFCSGALLQVNLAPDAGSAVAGLPAQPAVMFERGPAFETKPGFEGKVLAGYAADGNPLLSGVLLHPEVLHGKDAALQVDYGKGHVVLLGFKPQWRAQSHGTYKFLFDQLYTETGH